MQYSTYFLNLITLLLKEFVKHFMLFVIINLINGSKGKQTNLEQRRTQLDTLKARESLIKINSKIMKKRLTNRNFYITTQKIIYKTQFILIQKTGNHYYHRRLRKKPFFKLIMKMLKKFIDMHILVLKNTSNKTLALYINRNIIPIFVILVLWNKIRYSKLKILMKKKIIKKNYTSSNC